MTNYEKRMATANIDRYNLSTATKLSDVYDKYSPAKASAFEHCKQEMENRKGFGLRILSSNTFMFTAGFLATNKETGVVEFTFISPNYIATVDYI